MANDIPEMPPGTGTGWIDRREDAAVIAALIAKIGEQQATIAASDKTHSDGRIDRGQHQKQLLGAFGTLRLFDTVPEILRQGPFAPEVVATAPVSYRVACRISNGQPCPFSDRAPDVRGVALKFFTHQGVETDLLMTSEGGRSHARNAVQFMDFADVLVAQIAKGATGALEQFSRELLDGKFGLVEAARIVAVLARETTLRTVDSVATERFWGSVVRLGDVAFKYSLQPHDTTVQGTQADRESDNYLREDILSRLYGGPVRWQLCVQLFIDEASTPVQDASVAWVGTLIPVGELEIPARPSADDEVSVNQMAFNPANGFEPLGITHARRDVYAASAANRKDRGVLSSDEARRLL
ncbi:catalase [Paraburkholderia sp. GAS334]|uniref:catalase n=1 Tax=Paraburkholderia sp. GAS334 TaxID=3035131 RepID=UPI003D25B209